MMEAEQLVEGPFGKAERLTLPDIPKCAETVCYWLVTAPGYHPAWSQYAISVARLTDGLEGWDDPVHTFDGTTHELLVLAINPGEYVNGQPPPLFTLDHMHEFMHNGKLPYLVPVNIQEQFIATDEEMIQLTFFAVHGIVNGVISPEAPMSTETHRANWLAAMTKTLAHIRGEAHAP